VAPCDGRAPLAGRATLPLIDGLSDDEEAVLRFLRDQPRGQASHVQATHDNSYLRVQMRERRKRFAGRPSVSRLLGPAAR